MSEEFHNPYCGTKLVLILQRPDGCILFLYRRDNGTLSRWSLPSGQVEIDEDLTNGLARIASDQLGLTQEQVGEAKFVLTYPDEDGNTFQSLLFLSGRELRTTRRGERTQELVSRLAGATDVSQAP